MATPPKPDPVATAQGLTGALEVMAAELGKLSAYTHRTRRMTWGLAISLALDLILTVAIAGLAYQAHDASDAAAVARNATVISCQQTNVARGQSLQLWDFLLNLSAASQPANETPAQKAAGEKLLATLRAKVSATFAPRDCQKLLNAKQ